MPKRQIMGIIKKRGREVIFFAFKFGAYIFNMYICSVKREERADISVPSF